jgi:hypothetical protein
MHFEIFLKVRAPGKPGKASHQTKTPRDQLLVARGEKQVRVLLELFRLQLQGR